MKGPNVIAPQRPTTTLGMPASNSSIVPTAAASHFGSRSTIANAAPMATGTATTSAMAEVARVPTISGRAP
jgi:hypothetical protein